MTDITNTSLEAALIDQHVAGSFNGKLYAFVTVACDKGWQLGIAIANEQGYHPLEGKTFAYQCEAKHWARGLNDHIGRSDDSVIAIICSTMGGARVEIV